MGWTPETSAYQQVNAVTDTLIAAAKAREQMDEHLKLIALIEAGRHLLVGAKAMAQYVEQRFTRDTDYLVDYRLFLEVRRWFGRENIPHQDKGEAILSESVGIDVIDAHHNPVLKALLDSERGIPSPEALAATKYVSIISGTRGQPKLSFDIGDFISLVTLEAFEVEKFLNFLVDRYAEQRDRARKLIDKIKRGESPMVL